MHRHEFCLFVWCFRCRQIFLLRFLFFLHHLTHLWLFISYDISAIFPIREQRFTNCLFTSKLVLHKLSDFYHINVMLFYNFCSYLNFCSHWLLYYIWTRVSWCIFRWIFIQMQWIHYMLSVFAFMRSKMIRWRTNQQLLIQQSSF